MSARGNIFLFFAFYFLGITLKNDFNVLTDEHESFLFSQKIILKFLIAALLSLTQ